MKKILVLSIHLSSNILLQLILLLFLFFHDYSNQKVAMGFIACILLIYIDYYLCMKLIVCGIRFQYPWVVHFSDLVLVTAPIIISMLLLIKQVLLNLSAHGYYVCLLSIAAEVGLVFSRVSQFKYTS